MKYAIDETELARLEELSICGRGPFLDLSYAAEISKVGPALVAEVRRLREALNTFIEEDQSRVILVQQQMLDCMREKVEAWEWWDTVDHLYDNAVWSFELRQCAIDELYATLTAAREAVHADR